MGDGGSDIVPASSRLSPLTLQPPHALLPPFRSHLGLLVTGIQLA